MNACCSYPFPHRHYPEWLDETVITDHCECGKHPRSWTVNDLLTAWAQGR